MITLIVFLIFTSNRFLQQANGEDPDPAIHKCDPPTIKCTNSKYRSIDGSCNNLENPTWGMAETPYNRLTPFNYADGKNALPTAASGEPLPNARDLSLKLFLNILHLDPDYNLNTQQWGQTIAHDMSLTKDTSQNGSGDITCCDDNGQLIPSSKTEPACAPIEIPKNDPYHAPKGEKCMDFVRSTKDLKCSSPYQSISSVTGFMDASIVYGSNITVTAELRAGEGGKLKWEERHGRKWPPQASNVTSACPRQMKDDPCYFAGDRRVNQSPQLTLLQIVLFREHNRIATELARLNSHWDDEMLFQEARRIVIAEIQHINYYQYLPILLGYNNMLKKKLIYHEVRGYVSDYDPKVNPSILDEHATAAFRHFHTLIRGFLRLLAENRICLDAVRLSDWFNKPKLLEQDDKFDKLTRGLTAQAMDGSDQYLTSEVTQYLFKRDREYGDDLRAIDIQRGRDHGLSSYTKTREACGLTVPKTFDEMEDIPKKSLHIMKTLYKAPEDVDLMVGGALERHVKGALVGPTFLCIMLEQFHRTRVGDRYFYENGGDPTTAFTIDQLEAIRKNASMARLLCDNADGVKRMQPNAFSLISPSNMLTPCEMIPGVDLSPWKETSDKTYHEKSSHRK